MKIISQIKIVREQGLKSWSQSANTIQIDILDTALLHWSFRVCTGYYSSAAPAPVPDKTHTSSLPLHLYTLTIHTMAFAFPSCQVSKILYSKYKQKLVFCHFSQFSVLIYVGKYLTTFAGEPTFHSQYELNLMETYGTMVQFLLHMHQAKSNKCCQINGSLLGSYFLV